MGQAPETAATYINALALTRSHAQVRIKARDYVKKVAVYRDRVAVQLPSRVVLYELTPPADGAPGAFREPACTCAER